MMITKMMGTNKGRAIVIAGFFACCMLAGFVVGFLKGTGIAQFSNHKDLVWLAVPGAIIVSGFTLWFGAAWMKSLDEAAQEAHKWAWYWGGSGAMALSMIMLFIGMTPISKTIAIPSAFSGRTDPAAYAATGALWLLMLMIAGYGIAWGIWWLRRR